MSIAILDGHYQLHRSLYSKGSELTTSTGLPSGATYVFLKMLWNFKDLGQPIVVFDAPAARSKFRREIYPKYKDRTDENITEEKRLEREETSKLFNYGINTLKQILPKMGIPVVTLPEQEGDDVVYRLAEYFSAKGEQVWAVSDDKDYLQLMNLNNVKVFQPMKDAYWDKEKFSTDYGFDIKYFTLFKAMMGDDSDKIDGIPGIGDKTAAKIIKELQQPNLESLLNWANAGEKNLHTKIKENFQIVKRNLNLVDLSLMTLDLQDVITTYEKAKSETSYDVQFIVEQFKKYEFNTFSNWLTWVVHRRNLVNSGVGV